MTLPVSELDMQITRLKEVLRRLSSRRRGLFTKVVELTEQAEKTRDPVCKARMLLLAREYEYVDELEKRFLRAVDRLEDAREELRTGHEARALCLIQSAVSLLSTECVEIAHALEQFARELCGG